MHKIGKVVGINCFVDICRHSSLLAVWIRPGQPIRNRISLFLFTNILAVSFALSLFIKNIHLFILQSTLLHWFYSLKLFKCSLNKHLKPCSARNLSSVKNKHQNPCGTEKVNIFNVHLGVWRRYFVESIHFFNYIFIG